MIRLQEGVETVRWMPSAPLRPFVHRYLGFRDAGGVRPPERSLPTPYLTLLVATEGQLVLRVDPDPRGRTTAYDDLVGGLYTTPAFVHHDVPCSGIRIAVSPLGARTLFGLPAGELAGLDPHATEVLGGFATELRERVLTAVGWRERFLTVDRLLRRRLAGEAAPPPAGLIHAWRRIRDAAGVVRVDDVAREVGWSTRRLAQQFATEIGLSPKVTARVVRFDQARRQLARLRRAADELVLAQVAADCGYYDQAHLAREFVALAGLPPSRWLATVTRRAAGSVD